MSPKSTQNDAKTPPNGAKITKNAVPEASWKLLRKEFHNSDENDAPRLPKWRPKSDKNHQKSHMIPHRGPYTLPGPQNVVQRGRYTPNWRQNPLKNTSVLRYSGHSANTKRRSHFQKIPTMIKQNTLKTTSSRGGLGEAHLDKLNQITQMNTETHPF